MSITIIVTGIIGIIFSFASLLVLINFADDNDSSMVLVALLSLTALPAAIILAIILVAFFIVATLFESILALVRLLLGGTTERL